METVTATLAEGQLDRTVRDIPSPQDTALFILAVAAGCMSIAKNAQSQQALMYWINGLLH